MNLLIAMAVSLSLLGGTETQKPVSEVDVIWAMGSNNVITNAINLGMAGKLVGYNADERGNARSAAVQVERTMTGCRDKLFAYAQSRGVEKEKVAVKLLRGYDGLIVQAVAMREFIDNPSEVSQQAYIDATLEMSKIVDEYFGPEEPPATAP